LEHLPEWPEEANPIRTTTILTATMVDESFGAPVSLAQTARDKKLDEVQRELLAHCDILERAIRHTIHTLESTKCCESQWLAIARVDLTKGLMCLKRSVARVDFF
jgi:hypothetical protein